MLRLLIVLLISWPGTVYYTLRIFWATSRFSRDRDCPCDRLPKAWARLVLRSAAVKVVLVNPEVIDRSAPQVLIANHVSWFDVLALAAWIPGPFRFVAKKEIMLIPFFGVSVRRCGHILIDRKDRAKAVDSLENAKRDLEADGPTVIMFPEGTRSATGELGPFKKGAFVLAIQTGANVIPASISGSRAVMRKGSFLIRPGTITITFGTPIPIDEYTIEDRDRLTERAHEALSEMQRAR